MTPPGKNCELPGTVLSRYPTSPHVSASATDTRFACATNCAAISSTVMTALSYLYPENPDGTRAPHTDREGTEMFSMRAADADRVPRATPVALCRRLVIAPALWKGEAVMHSGVHFALTGNACPCEPALQFFDHRQRCERVVLGTGDIELARDLAERAMRALLRLADQPGPVKRRGSSNAVGIARRCRQRVGTAHTVAMAARSTWRHCLLPIDKREHGGDILHHRRDRHR